MLCHEAIGQLPTLLDMLFLLFGLQHVLPQSADRLQQLDLLAGCDHRIMQPLEIVIVALNSWISPSTSGWVSMFWRTKSVTEPTDFIEMV